MFTLKSTMYATLTHCLLIIAIAAPLKCATPKEPAYTIFSNFENTATRKSGNFMLKENTTLKEYIEVIFNDGLFKEIKDKRLNLSAAINNRADDQAIFKQFNEYSTALIKTYTTWAKKIKNKTAQSLSAYLLFFYFNMLDTNNAILTTQDAEKYQQKLNQATNYNQKIEVVKDIEQNINSFLYYLYNLATKEKTENDDITHNVEYHILTYLDTLISKLYQVEKTSINQLFSVLLNIVTEFYTQLKQQENQSNGPFFMRFKYIASLVSNANALELYGYVAKINTLIKTHPQHMTEQTIKQLNSAVKNLLNHENTTLSTDNIASKAEILKALVSIIDPQASTKGINKSSKPQDLIDNIIQIINKAENTLKK